MKDLLTGFTDKKGSFAVLALMSFLSLLILLLAAADSAGKAAVGSVVESFGRLWGTSILAEYDIFLKEKYGIMAFEGDEATVDEKIGRYADYSLKEKKYADYSRPVCNLKKYSLSDPANLKKEIKKIIESGTSPKKEREYDNGKKEGNKVKERRITSQWIIRGLPSYGKTEKSYIMSLVNKIKNGISLETITGDIFIEKYIFTFFKDYMDDRNLTDTYFNYEVEYIISGKCDEKISREKTETKIKTVRNMLNMYYLYTCDEKRNVAMAVASSITPGPAAVLTQAVLLEMWAYAEAENDIRILYDKKTVPLLKKDDNWALSLDNVLDDRLSDINAEGKKDYVSPEIFKGEDYEGYLKILLYGIDEDTKLLRIMDLIQINLKFLYSESFLIKEYNIGLKYDIRVNERNHEFEESYWK